MTSNEINGLLIYIAIGILVGISFAILRYKKNGETYLYVFYAGFTTALLFAFYAFLTVMLSPSEIGVTLQNRFSRSLGIGCYAGFIAAICASTPAALTTAICSFLTPRRQPAKKLEKRNQ